MGASHSVEATDTTVVEIVVPEPEPVSEPEPEDDLEQSMDWFWPFV